MSVLIIRYGEISLKSHSVRRRFTDALIRNIQDALFKADIEGYIEEERGRLYLYTDDRRSIDVVKNVFGIVSVSWAESTDSDMEHIANLAVELFPCKKGTFAVRATRTGNHPYTSQELPNTLL
jgi:thiamine biosynthesis protein ThiI